MIELADRLRIVQRAFADAPVFVRPYLLPVLELLESIVFELAKGKKDHGKN